ncbi:MAG: hypothetical protein OEN50_02775 [Deltaproteobacteria bacterium]|nr:hypothetical protein [Deltaproteobacteria bacterium]
MKIFGNPPFSLFVVVCLMAITIWVIVAHDMLISNDQGNQWAVAQSSPAASPALADAKKQEIPPQVSPPAVAPMESKVPAGEGLPETPVVSAPEKKEGLPVNKPAEIIQPLEPPKKTPSALRNFPAKSLRSEDWKLPTGDLRTGADSKPMGNLRSPTESNIDGSLRPDEKSLPSGSLRKEEQSLPTGSLR